MGKSYEEKNMEKAQININHLPPEVLADIFCFLGDRDLVNVSCTCRCFQLAAKIELIWQDKCTSVLGQKQLELKDYESFFDLYTKLIYRYGYLHGLWQADYGCYGGIFDIRFEDNLLVGTEYTAPPHNHVMGSLRRTTAFTIGLKEDKTELALKCHRGFKEPHLCQITEGTQQADKFTFKCLEPHNHKHPVGKEQEFEEWMWEQIAKDDEQNVLDAFQGMNLLKIKFNSLSEHSDSFQCERLNVTFKKKDVILQPGLFKGTYSMHGIEILELSYDDDKNNAVLTKVTGDPNVPATKISVIADLTRPMVLTAQQQNSLITLKEIDIPDMPPNIHFSKLPVQPFIEPFDCLSDNLCQDKVKRNTCIARYHSQGQIAGTGFASSSYTAGHLIVFDEDTFAHMWLTLRALSLYTRVKEFG